MEGFRSLTPVRGAGKTGLSREDDKTGSDIKEQASKKQTFLSDV